MRALLLATLVLAACSDDPPKTYETYQACFDDVNRDSESPADTIVSCCLDFEVMGAEPPICGETEPDCINYLTANLRQIDADITVKQSGCTAYVAAKAMEQQ